MEFSRKWSMPNSDTFSMIPVRDLLVRVLDGRERVVDPFARNSAFATHTNDLDPETAAQHHMLAPDYLSMLLEAGDEGTFDAAILDPPYSPRQISECYGRVGLKASTRDTQNARLCKECKDGMARLLKRGGLAVTCGWNSNGFGKGRGFEMLEVLLVYCGGAHNDYIVTVEEKK